MMNSTAPKICIAAICKNEERFIKFFIDSLCALGFKDFIFVDTGSTDSTIKIIESFKSDSILIFKEKFDKIAFDDFRNALWTKVLQYSNCDYALVLDVDELLINVTHAEISAFLQKHSHNAFSINRFDICDWEKTTLKRLLKIMPGTWCNCVHEHFQFDKNDELSLSEFNVVHLSTERIRSKNKLKTYSDLVDVEYNNSNMSFLYFKIIDAFSKFESNKLYEMFEEFKSRVATCNNFFNELIIFTLIKFSILNNDALLKNELIDLSSTLNIKDVIVDKYNSFITKINSPNVTITKAQNILNISSLGRPTTMCMIFRNVMDVNVIKPFMQCIQDKFPNDVTDIDILSVDDEIMVKISINNDLVFYQKYFGGFILQEQVQFAKLCFYNKITRSVYYEQ